MPNNKSVNRQAIVIIHGIGEQRPMKTLRSFVDAILKIENRSSGVSWSKPDTVSEGFEHHRFTLPGTRTRPITDVYELYWAHLFEQSNPSTFTAWAGRLLLRPMPKLPRRFQIISLSLWIALVILGGGGFFWLWNTQLADHRDALIAAVPIIGGAYTLIIWLANSFFLGTISDAARYLDANPRNVEARNNVRTLGVNFLDKLHKSERNYDRIVVCGHSLGTVIGYDILQRLWYKMHETFEKVDRPDQEILKQMSKQAEAMNGPAARALQRDLWLEQQDMGSKWLVTDFVTMGSPLAHADVLMADSDEEFEEGKVNGEFPTCPPVVDPNTKLIGFKRDYEIPGGQRRTCYLLRHNAMFAVTRWTNIHFRTRLGLFGDPIGGSVSRVLGGGVQDYEVKTTGFKRLFAHLRYWHVERIAGDADEDLSIPLHALRDALDLDRKVITPSDDGHRL